MMVCCTPEQDSDSNGQDCTGTPRWNSTLRVKENKEMHSPWLQATIFREDCVEAGMLAMNRFPPFLPKLQQSFAQQPHTAADTCTLCGPITTTDGWHHSDTDQKKFLFTCNSYLYFQANIYALPLLVIRLLEQNLLIISMNSMDKCGRHNEQLCKPKQLSLSKIQYGMGLGSISCSSSKT